MTAPSNAIHVMLVDDEEDIRISVQQSLELKGLEVACFARAADALVVLDRAFGGVIVSDIRMPKMDGLQFLDAVLEVDADQPVILITGHGDVPLAVEALRKGAYDFIEKPFAPDRLLQSIERAAEKRRLTLENRELRGELAGLDPLEVMILGRSDVMAGLRRKVGAVAASDLDVLIVGETGTGKDLVARAIHGASPRQGKPFVTISLAALPADMIEAELAGHVAGAFPGAIRHRTGRLEHARGGTVHLDEIGSLPLELQVKLLRILEDRSVQPLGGGDPVALDVRFIASTRDDPAALVREGRFRDDLLYRLNPVTLHLPPLREREGDVPRLFQHFIGEAARRYRREAVEVAPEVLMRLADHDWPGNVRELRNAAERHLLGIDGEGPGDEAGSGLAEQVDRFERGTIAAALAAHGGNLKTTYEALGVSRKTLYDKMQKYGLRREDFAPEGDD